MSSNLAPVVLFAYARYESTIRVVESLQECAEFYESPFYIYLDFPREEGLTENNRNLITYFKTSEHPNLHLVCREKNYGLARNIINGVTEVFNRHDKVIVLEDDLIVSKTFLAYMNAALVYYEAENEISSIHGYVYPGCETGKPEFHYGADCWGWATWKSRWDKDIFKFENIKYLCANTKRSKFFFNYLMSFPFQRMLEEQSTTAQLKSWAIVWHAYNYVYRKLCVYPPKSLISNIGLDNSGENCSELVYYTDALQVEFNPAECKGASKKSFILFACFFWRRRLEFIFLRLRKLIG